LLQFDKPNTSPCITLCQQVKSFDAMWSVLKRSEQAYHEHVSVGNRRAILGIVEVFPSSATCTRHLFIILTNTTTRCNETFCIFTHATRFHSIQVE